MAEPNIDRPVKNELAEVDPAAPEKEANSNAPLPEAVPAAKEAAPLVPVMRSSSEPVPATLSRQGGNTAITFAFGEPMAGALFRRGETIFLVFDTARPIQVGELASAAPRFLREIEQIELPQGRLIKLKLDKSRLASLESDGASWVVNIGDMMSAPSRPLPVRRVYAAESRAGLFVPLAAPGRVHVLDDPDSGDGLVVVTAEPPARGLARAQDFVDFRALATTHGVVLAPKADDLMIELAPEGITITRPAGLVVSEMGTALPPLPEAKKRLARALTPLDPEIWKAEREAPFYDREMELARAVAETPLARRAEQRVALARFYLAHDFPANAAGTIEAATMEETQSGDDAGIRPFACARRARSCAARGCAARPRQALARGGAGGGAAARERAHADGALRGGARAVRGGRGRPDRASHRVAARGADRGLARRDRGERFRRGEPHPQRVRDHRRLTGPTRRRCSQCFPPVSRKGSARAIRRRPS